MNDEKIKKEFENAFKEYQKEKGKYKNNFLNFTILEEINDPKIAKEITKLTQAYEISLDVINNLITGLMKITGKVNDLDVLLELFILATQSYKKSNEFREVMEGD